MPRPGTMSTAPRFPSFLAASLMAAARPFCLGGRAAPAGGHVDSSTPGGRAQQLREIEGSDIRRNNSMSLWNVAMRLATREHARTAIRAQQEMPASTHEGRMAQLREIEASELRSERARADARHQPGSSASSCYDRVGHWENRLDEAEAWFDRADQEWRDLRAGFGEYPTLEQAGVIRAAERGRDRLADEAAHCRQRRDLALEECAEVRDAYRDAIW
jgi:hypothetical protein